MSSTLCGVLAASLLFVLAPRPSLAQGKCAGSKLKAACKKASCKAQLEATEAQMGAAPDPAKVAKCEATFSKSFAKSDAKGGCQTTGDAATVEAMVDAYVGDLASELDVSTGTNPNKCEADKIKAAAKKASCKCRLEARQAETGGTIDPARVARCEAHFSKSLAYAEAKGGCNTTGDAAVIEAKTDAFLADLEPEPPPPTTTTTTTTLPPVCGNGVREGSGDEELPTEGEQCDGDDNVHPVCRSSGRSGCFPPGHPDECSCCGTGEVAIDNTGTVVNECCPGYVASPLAPGYFLCLPEPTCDAAPFPECGGSCPPGEFSQCVPVVIDGNFTTCACGPPGPCDGTCDGSECPAGEACDPGTCSCVPLP
jgi:hypothetical protein